MVSSWSILASNSFKILAIIFELELAGSLQMWAKWVQGAVGLYTIARLEWKVTARAPESYLKDSQNCCLTLEVQCKLKDDIYHIPSLHAQINEARAASFIYTWSFLLSVRLSPSQEGRGGEAELATKYHEQFWKVRQWKTKGWYGSCCQLIGLH